MPVEPNRSHPLLRGVEYILLGSMPFDLRLKPTVTFTVPVQAVCPAGRALTASATSYLAMPSTAGTGAWTLAAVITPNASLGPTQTHMGTCEAPGSATMDRQLRYGATGNWSSYVFDGGAQFADTGVVPVIGRSDIVVGSCTGTSLIAAANGTEATTAVANAGYNGYASPEFCIGNSSVASATDLVSLAVRIIGIAWDSGMRRAFYENPWQIFKPTKRVIYIDAPAANILMAQAIF